MKSKDRKKHHSPVSLILYLWWNRRLTNVDLFPRWFIYLQFPRCRCSPKKSLTRNLISIKSLWRCHLFFSQVDSGFNHYCCMTYCFSLPNKNRRLCWLTFFWSRGLLASTLNNVSATVTTLPLQEVFFWWSSMSNSSGWTLCSNFDSSSRESLNVFFYFKSSQLGVLVKWITWTLLKMTLKWTL